MDAKFTARQLREIEYHRNHAERHAGEALEPLDMTVVHDTVRRWWNGYWYAYTLLRNLDLRGKRVLVPGCGSGKDVVRVAALGAQAYGFDISPDMVRLARARTAGFSDIHLEVSSSEALPYAGGFFDVVFFCDILHHVDIRPSLAEVSRVMKPGGTVVGSELYTHDFLQWFRAGLLVERLIYPAMKHFIYRTDNPYITVDEHKISQEEFFHVKALCLHLEVYYFDLLVGRLIPQAWPPFWHKLDRLVMRALGPGGAWFAGRVVFQGRLADQPTC